MSVSVIIPTRDHATSLRDTIESLLHGSSPGSSFEIVVVDNGSEDHTRDVVAGFEAAYPAHTLRYVHEPVPGLLAGRHRGAEVASGDVLVYVDDDILADEVWLAAIVEVFDDPSVQLVGGRNVPSYEVDPPEWLSAFWQTHEYGTWCGYLSLLDFGDEKQEIDPAYVWGLNYAIRKQALIALGGFHPDGVPWELRRYRGDGESGLSRKAREMKLKAVYQPKALVYHKVPCSRLTIEYFERRAFLQGISDSYSSIRRHGGLHQNDSSKREWDWKDPLRKLKRNIKELRARVQNPHYEITVRVQGAYKAGYAFHQAEVRNDPSLLEWVLKEDYWDYRLPIEEELTV